MKTLERLREAVEDRRFRGAWDNGVKEYALELLDELAEYSGDFPVNSKLLEKALLNGAETWHQYSWGGCSLLYNSDIAERMCNATELKRNKNGKLPPNEWEDWLDVQARALGQAAMLITAEFRGL